MPDSTETREADSSAGKTITRRVVVSNQLGLHARPAGKLAQEAQSFKADITILADDQEVDAKSILDILTLAAAQGSTLNLKAAGADAKQALDRLEELFRSRFGEER